MKRRKIRRNMSEKKLMKLKRQLRKRAKKLRLGKKRTGAYVFGTLRRVRGNPLSYHVGGLSSLGAVRERKRQERMAKRKAKPIPGMFYRVYWSAPERGETTALIFKGEQLLKLSISDLSRYWPLREGLKMAKVHFRGPYDSWDNAFMDR